MPSARECFQDPLGNPVPWDEIIRRHGHLTFDQVLIPPLSNTNIESRHSVDTSIMFGPYKLDAPFISAPMDTVTGEQMARAMHKAGGIAALPRPYPRTLSTTLDICRRLNDEEIPCVYSVGLNGGLDQAKELQQQGAQIILIDTAHGGQARVIQLAHEILRLNLHVVVGNIATYQQAKWYNDEGIHIARVGIGGGSVCDTRNVTGVGIPQFTAVLATQEAGISVIADGGIRFASDVAKALGAGAELVMVGRVLAGTLETPGDVINGKKKYRGQASGEYMQDYDIQTQAVAEGISTEVPALDLSAIDVINNLNRSLKSTMSYVGATNIGEFHENVKFIFCPQVTHENMTRY